MASGWLTPLWPLRVNADGIVREAVDEFVKEIAAGNTDWPVRTGASQAGMYADDNPLGVYNHEDYAIHVENASRSPHQGVLARAWESYDPNVDEAWGKGLLG